MVSRYCFAAYVGDVKQLRVYFFGTKCSERPVEYDGMENTCKVRNVINVVWSGTACQQYWMPQGIHKACDRPGGIGMYSPAFT